MRRGGICDRNPKKCRFSREHSCCASYTNVFFFLMHNLNFEKFYLFMTIYNAESWIRRRWQKKQQMVSTWCGPFGREYGNGTVIVLTCGGCVPFHSHKPNTKTQSIKGSICKFTHSLSLYIFFLSQFYYFTMNLLHRNNFLFFFSYDMSFSSMFGVLWCQNEKRWM